MPVPIVRIRIIGDDAMRLIQRYPNVVAATLQATTLTVMRDIVWSRVKANLMGAVLNRRSGNLLRDVESSIQVRRTFKGVQGTIGTSLDYGIAWELGAQFPAYNITPKKATFLRFIGARDGAVVFTKLVERKPRRQEKRSFIVEAFEARMVDIERKYVADLNRLHDQIGVA